MTIDTLFFCVIKLQIEQSAIQLASYNHAMQCKSARTVNSCDNIGIILCQPVTLYVTPLRHNIPPKFETINRH